MDIYVVLGSSLCCSHNYTTGRVLDSSGSPMEGSHFVRFALYESDQGGTVLWEDSLYSDGKWFYSTEVGANPLNPLDSDLLLVGGLYLK